MSITDALMEAVQNLPDDKQQEVLDFAEFLQNRRVEPQPKVPLPPQNNLLALLQRWRQEDAVTDEESLRAAQAELDEFKQNMNANRIAAGEPILFP